jgi:TatD DNase family protein
MKLIDSHCHLYLPDFKGDIGAVIQRATLEGVEKFFLPAIDSNSFADMISLEIQYPDKCISMMGLHPCSVKNNYKEELIIVENWLQKRKFSAIGEIGLDFYWDKTFGQQQLEAFKIQIEWALYYKLPIIIHTRNAMQETINVIKEYSSKGLKGIFHCFSGSYENAKDIINAGFYLGIGGVVTYKNSGLAEVLAKIDIKYLVLETDSPYLSPVPYRGKRNESSYLKYIVKRLAEIKKVSIEEVANITTANTQKIFGY